MLTLTLRVRHLITPWLLEKVLLTDQLTPIVHAQPGGLRLIKASVPLSEMFQYVSTLRGMTKGRAQYSMQLEKYDVVPNSIQDKIVGAHASKVAA